MILCPCHIGKGTGDRIPDGSCRRRRSRDSRGGPVVGVVGWSAYRSGGARRGRWLLAAHWGPGGGGLVITHALAHSVGAWDEHVNALFARHRTPTGNRVTGDFTLLANTPGIAGVAVVVVGDRPVFVAGPVWPPCC